MAWLATDAAMAQGFGVRGPSKVIGNSAVLGAFAAKKGVVRNGSRPTISSNVATTSVTINKSGHQTTGTGRRPKGRPPIATPVEGAKVVRGGRTDPYRR